MKNFDIIPKRGPSRLRAAAEGVSGALKKAAIPARPAEKQTVFPKKRRVRRTVASAVTAIVVLLLVLLFLVLPEAKIQAVLRSEPVAREFEIRLDSNQDQPDASELVVPGRLLSQEMQTHKTFPATGTRNVGRQASGFVYIYNFSKTTLILRAQTTVLRVGSREYFFTQDVGNIRPTALIGLADQEVDPTSLIPPVPVIAALPGEEYNLPTGARLEIENEVFGHQPEALYAVAADEIGGGTTEEIKIVTQTDVLNSQIALVEDARINARTVLARDDPRARLLDQAMNVELLEHAVSIPAGSEAPEFEAAVRVKLMAVVFQDDEVERVATERISRLLPANKKLKPERGQITSNLINLNLEQGAGTLLVRYEGLVVFHVDREELLERVKGKNEREIVELLKSRPEIEAVETRFYPFWVKRAPKFSQKIHLELVEPKDLTSGLFPVIIFSRDKLAFKLG